MSVMNALSITLLVLILSCILALYMGIRSASAASVDTPVHLLQAET
jgi:hypothetical protein